MKHLPLPDDLLVARHGFMLQGIRVSMARFITSDVKLRVMAGLLATACAVVFATRVFVAADPVRLRVLSFIGRAPSFRGRADRRRGG